VEPSRRLIPQQGTGRFFSSAGNARKLIKIKHILFMETSVRKTGLGRKRVLAIMWLMLNGGETADWFSRP
jgi:hypothetical protein